MKEVLQAIINNLVSLPDQVEIFEKNKGRFHDFIVTVAPQDMGAVIGKNGSISISIRTILNSMTKDKVSIKFKAKEIAQ